MVIRSPGWFADSLRLKTQALFPLFPFEPSPRYHPHVHIPRKLILTSTFQPAEKKPREGRVHVFSWRAWPGSYTYHFCFHLIGPNTITLTHLAAREMEKSSLYLYSHVTQLETSLRKKTRMNISGQAVVFILPSIKNKIC